MEAYTLKKVNEYIKQVIALNFEESIWIEAEISQIKEVRGQIYIEFIEKHEQNNNIIAKAQGVIWYKSFMFIKTKLKELTESILQEGQQIRFKAKVEFHEIYGLKFSVEDLDPSYTIGKAELNRQKIIAKLKQENLLYKNKETSLPLIIKNIAIISSHKAAGLQDFFSHLNNNPYGYFFNTVFFDSSMQGYNVERDITKNLDIIKDNINPYDCVVIIRGGGSKMDLSYFDNYNISAKIAKFPIPVFTGIGHDIDQNVIELVAHTPLKTPTAVADFIVEYNLRFEMEINELEQKIKGKASSIIHESNIKLEIISGNIKSLALSKVSGNLYLLDSIFNSIKNQASKFLLMENSRIRELSGFIDLSNPENLLKKGYSITTKNGKIIKSIKNIVTNDIVKTVLQDGEFDSTVN
jgi:exodeoxyribonuclease VII large subunit